MERVIIALVLVATASAQCAPYSYDNPSAWPGLCATGKNQSPVHVVSTSTKPFSHYLFTLYSPWQNLVAESCPCCFYNVTLPAQGSLILKDFNGQSLVYKPAYMLVHTPSEHTIDGNTFDMEVQIYHSLYSGSTPYSTATVSMFFNVGSESPFFDQFVNLQSGKPSSTIPEFSLSMLLYQTTTFSDYYIYPGSLTVPPCTENVLWVLLTPPQPPLTVSQAQIDVFTGFFTNQANSRGIQPLGSRRVYYKQ